MQSKNKRYRREAKLDGGREDPFNRLSDEVISSNILSRFTLEEGAQYRILSHRWKKLWSYGIGSKLIFAPDHPRPGCSTKSLKRLVQAKVPSYERWITTVLQAYNGPKLDEFTVRFPFTSRIQASIDTWVESALRKGVTRLELDFSLWGKPHVTFHTPTLEKYLLTMPARASSIRYLTDVTLKSIVTDEFLEFLIVNCPLERLCIWNSSLEKVRISGGSVRLKSLELENCLGKVKIWAPELVSVKCDCPVDFGFFLKDVPQLSELSIGENISRYYLRRGIQHFSFITQLKSLELFMRGKDVLDSVNYPMEFPQALQLEELKVTMDRENDNSCLLWPILLIKASPLLRKFVVKISAGRLKPPVYVDVDLTKLKDATKILQRHQHLKLVEFHRFTGVSCEVELVRHLLNISDSLEHLVVLPPYERGISFETPHFLLTKITEDLVSLVPPHSDAKVMVM